MLQKEMRVGPSAPGAFHAHPANIDGIVYMSRYLGNRRSVAFSIALGAPYDSTIRCRCCIMLNWLGFSIRIT